MVVKRLAAFKGRSFDKNIVCSERERERERGTLAKPSKTKKKKFRKFALNERVK